MQGWQSPKDGQHRKLELISTIILTDLPIEISPGLRHTLGWCRMSSSRDTPDLDYFKVRFLLSNRVAKKSDLVFLLHLKCCITRGSLLSLC